MPHMTGSDENESFKWPFFFPARHQQFVVKFAAGGSLLLPAAESNRERRFGDFGEKN